MNEQLTKFKEKKAPIHCFYLGAKDAFTKLSLETKGKAEKFDIDSPKASDKLTAFIVEQILELIELNEIKEGKENLNLVDAYRKMFT